MRINPHPCRLFPTWAHFLHIMNCSHCNAPLTAVSEACPSCGTACTKASQPSYSNPISDIIASPIQSKEKAVLIVRITAGLYSLVVLLNVVAFALDVAPPFALITVPTLVIFILALVLANSRIAAILILVFVSVDMISIWLGEPSSESPSVSRMIWLLSGLQIAVTIKCVMATFTIHGPFRWRRASPSFHQTHQSKGT